MQLGARVLAIGLCLVVWMTERTPAAETPDGAANGYVRHVVTAEAGAEALAALTGTAVSPLLCVAIRSTAIYISTDDKDRDALPWYCQPAFFGAMFLLLALLAAKGTVCEATPFLKKPLDAAAVLVSTPTALLTMPIVLMLFAEGMGPAMEEALRGLGKILFPTAQAAEASPALGIVGMLGYGVSLLLGAVIYGVVWIVSDVVEVLILISPFPGVDAALKTARIAVIGLVMGITQLYPVLGVCLCAGLITLCFLVAARAVRLSFFGWVYALDLFLFRSGRAPDALRGPVAFTGAGMRGLLPRRTYGRLIRDESGRMVFSCRRFMVGPKRSVVLPDATGALDIGRGLLYPTLVCSGAGDRLTVMADFPPRYRGAEEKLGLFLGTRGIRDASVLRGFRNLWRWLMGGVTAPGRPCNGGAP